jgi:hypothetical protein
MIRLVAECHLNRLATRLNILQKWGGLAPGCDKGIY